MFPEIAKFIWEASRGTRNDDIKVIIVREIEPSD